MARLCGPLTLRQEWQKPLPPRSWSSIRGRTHGSSHSRWGASYRPTSTTSPEPSIPLPARSRPAGECASMLGQSRLSGLTCSLCCFAAWLSWRRVHGARRPLGRYQRGQRAADQLCKRLQRRGMAQRPCTGIRGKGTLVMDLSWTMLRARMSTWRAGSASSSPTRWSR